MKPKTILRKFTKEILDRMYDELEYSYLVGNGVDVCRRRIEFVQNAFTKYENKLERK